MLVSSIFRVIEGLLVSPHLPLDAAWVCLAGIELGMHSRVRAAPEGRSLTFESSWAQSRTETHKGRVVEGKGKRFAKWSKGEIWESPRQLDNLTVPPSLSLYQDKMSSCPTHQTPSSAPFPRKTCLGVYSLFPSF